MRRTKPEQDHTSAHLERFRAPVSLQPIGVVGSPYTERFGTPRQPQVTRQVKGDEALPGRIELLADRGFELALADLAGFDRIWCLYVFHLNDPSVALQVRSPRDPDAAHGVFATRAPHRPNPIGLSCLRLVEIKGLTLHVLGLDMLDGTPVLDIKPYLPYADAFPEAAVGWMRGRDPDEPDSFEP